VTIEVGTIEERKAALQMQAQGLDRRLVEIDRQGQQLQRERGQVIANLNAVGGALELCDDLLKAGRANPVDPDPAAMTLEQLKERIGPDEAKGQSSEQAAEGQKGAG